MSSILSFPRLIRAALVAFAAAILVAAPASAARPRHRPPPPPALSARSLPPGVHARHMHVIRHHRVHVAHRHGARLASLPPVNTASIPTWRSGSALCDVWNIDSYTGKMTDWFDTPYVNEYPSPGRGWVRMYWQAGIYLWDRDRNRWVQGPYTTVQWSNPINANDYWVAPYFGTGGVQIPRTLAWGYTWVHAWWHYTATYDESMSGTGGVLYSDNRYLKQTSFGGSMANGGCWWG